MFSVCNNWQTDLWQASLHIYASFTCVVKLLNPCSVLSLSVTVITVAINKQYSYACSLIHVAFTLCAEWHTLNSEIITVSVRFGIMYILQVRCRPGISKFAWCILSFPDWPSNQQIMLTRLCNTGCQWCPFIEVAVQPTDHADTIM